MKNKLIFFSVSVDRGGGFSYPGMGGPEKMKGGPERMKGGPERTRGAQEKLACSRSVSCTCLSQVQNNNLPTTSLGFVY